MNFDECILFAPGGRFKDENLELAINKLKRQFPEISYKGLKPEGLFSGSLSARRTQFLDALKSADASTHSKWIMAVRGGYGAFDLLEDFSKATIKKPTVISGFSDITVLLNQHQENKRFMPVYGMNALASFTDEVSEVSVKHIEMIISDFDNFNYDEEIFTDMTVLSTGEVESTIFGGCLTVLMTLVGTVYFPDLRDKILFLEDINEPVYKLDRMLNQLQTIGVLDEISGLILGEFVGTESQFGVTPLNIFDKYFKKRQYPVVRNFPMGHGSSQVPIKFSWPVSLKANESGNLSIQYLHRD